MKQISKMMMAALLVVGLAACGESAATTAPAATAPATGGEGAPAAGGASITVGTAPGFEFKFAQENLEVPAGDVSLTLDNTSGQPHNWTLVKQGEEDKANTEGQANPPQYQSPSALAQTKTINGAEKDTITFKVEPGTYSYICTFPGHYPAGMKGVLVVK